MVSTRGPKFKFSDGEKVLCYEPDPTKAKVLYDSKVLDVIVNKDQRGRKAVEYLIHFQGWNSSWDRCVTEEYVLKDTEENRQLQRDLAQKAQLQLGAYLYRRERKKRSHKYSSSTEVGTEAKRRAQSSGSRTTSGTTGSSEDGSSGQQEDYDTEDIVSEEEMESSSNFDETSADDSGDGSQSGASVRPGVDIEIGATLKRLLEQDFNLIVNNNKLHVLPAQPTVVNIIESWVQHYTTTQLTNIPDKPQRNKVQNNLEKTINDINICRETADGLRIYFDHTLGDLLLYKQEKEQYLTMKEVAASSNSDDSVVKEEAVDPELVIKEEVEDPEFAHLPPFREQEPDKTESEKTAVPTVSNTRRKLRSCRLNSTEEPKAPRPVEEVKQETGGNLSSLASTSSRCSSPRGVTLRMSMPVINSAQINSLLEDSKKWRLMPERELKVSSPKPSMVYGAIHLARLFVKLPELLQMTDISEKKLKVLLKNLDMFLSYLENHREWFGEQFYMQRTCQSDDTTTHP
ncbi:male-specific lethal 3 homolog isoform X2 [Copidosoma floridanum]|uniref:male-specific lethal 3 homolog isoform X2 n=1 Tax=Copidosoma floridanum TaxID=29053 RepID=UPI0006C9D094|nr:male-specific lethal 3 homolog isoform X2 [Copidosoma floridanum]